MRVGQCFARDRTPGLEPFPPGGQRADARFDSVRDQQGRVHAEQRRQFGLIGLELLPGGPDGRVFVCRVLEFDDPERQAVDEQHHIGPALVLILNNRKLIDCQPVVIDRRIEINHLRLRATYRPVVRAILYGHAIYQHAVKGTVAGLRCRPVRVGQLPKSVVQGFGRQVGVEQSEGVA